MMKYNCPWFIILVLNIVLSFPSLSLSYNTWLYLFPLHASNCGILCSIKAKSLETRCGESPAGKNFFSFFCFWTALPPQHSVENNTVKNERWKKFQKSELYGFPVQVHTISGSTPYGPVYLNERQTSQNKTLTLTWWIHYSTWNYEAWSMMDSV